MNGARRIFLGMLLCFVLCTRAAAQPAWYEGNNDGAPSLAQAMRRYAHEPSVEALLEAAASLPELRAETVRRMRRRARLAALLPRIQLRARRGQGVDLNERVGEIRTSTDDSLTLEAVLEWHLDGAAFSNAEPQLLREAQQRGERLRQRNELLIQVYFERRRLQLERDLLANESSRDALVRSLRIEELAALLDVLSGGAFLPPH